MTTTPRKRRGHGDGAIYQRGDGRWVASLDLGYANGKRQRKVVYGKTRREAADKLKDLTYAQRQGRLVMSDQRTLGDFLDMWLEDVVKPSVRARTHESYEGVVRLRIKPDLGHVRLGKLTTAQVQRLLATRAEHLSARGVEYTWQVLVRALHVAVDWNLLAINVAAKAKPPRPAKSEVQPMSVEDMRAVLAACTDHRLEAAFVLALTTGMRRGEVLGLQWSDLDLDAGALRVRRTLHRVGGKLHAGEPKSAKGRRTVALSGLALAALKRHRVRQAQQRLALGEAWHDGDWVFTTGDGKPLDPRNFLGDWHALLGSVGLEPRPLHHARHGAASLMLSQGVPLKIVQETLGHSTVSLTVDLYGHLMPGDIHRVAQAIDHVMGSGA